MNKKKALKLTLSLLAIEAFLCVALLLSIPGDPKNEIFLGYSAPRLIMAIALLAAGLFFSYTAYTANKEDHNQFLLGIEKAFSSRPAFLLLLLLFCANLALLLTWEFAAPENLALLERSFPVFLYSNLVLGHLLIWQFVWGNQTGNIRLGIAAVSLMLLIFYLAGTLNYSEINTQFELSDQNAYIEFARKVRQSGFEHTGGRNFMHLYPFLQALFLDPSSNNDQIFFLGKIINILLSVLLVGAIFVLTRRYLSFFSAYTLTLVTAFSLFVYKAAYFQPELLFYYLFFLMFLMMSSQIVKPNWKSAIVLGIISGLAYLTKAAVLPALFLFGITMILLFVIHQSKKGDTNRRIPNNFNNPLTFVLSIIIVYGFFFATVSPYIIESKQKYGQYFYNVNTTFYLWYDSWNEAKLGTRAYGDNISWPDMPQDEIPSAQKYVEEHTHYEIVSRQWKGIQSQAENLWNTYSWLSYLAIYTLAMVFGLWLARSDLRKFIARQWMLILFVSTFVFGYLALYAWYAPIAEYADQRFTYSLYLPILFSIFVALEKLFNSKKVYQFLAIKKSGSYWVKSIHLFVILMLSFDLVFKLPEKLTRFDWYGK